MRSAVLCALALTLGGSLLGGETERLQVGGEWCFIKTPAATRPGEAVILLHGNGETVEADSSSWERGQGQTALMETLLEAGFLLAHSNHTGVPGNGMWGNAASQTSVLALMEHLRSTRGVEVFHAIAISAGNAILLNLVLDGKATFQTAVLIAPVLSLESLYRCPAGVDRVSGLAAAFDFEPAHGCPGDPEADEAFRGATGPHDPLRKIRAVAPAARSALSATRWMALYDRGDPKVIPEENLLAFLELLRPAGLEVRVRSQKKDTHTPRDLLLSHRDEIAALLAQPLDPASEDSGTAPKSGESPLPHPEETPFSPLMLAGDWVPEDPHRIDFDRLPRVPSERAVVSDVGAAKGVNQHNYLVHHDGRLWAMWSDGPGREDRVGQRVKYATSPDGGTWSTPRFLTPEPPGSGPDSEFYNTRDSRGFRWISRGFWQRQGELLALASLDEAAGFFGPSLELRAFRFDPGAGSWEDAGRVFDDTINNFPPKRLAGGDWMMSRRTHDYKDVGVHFLVGGREGIDRWESFPVLGSSSELAAEEPLWWTLPEGGLMALFRDNRRSGYLYRSFSTDGGRTWSRPVQTNYPDATSKLHGLRLTDGRYVLVSNANPRKRDPLVLAISEDGLVFSEMGYLVGGRHVDYPHVIEHDGHLLVAFAGNHKETVEVLKVRLADLDGLGMPASVELPQAVASRPVQGGSTLGPTP